MTLLNTAPQMFDPYASTAVDLTPSQDPAPDGLTVLGAAFRQENVVGSLLARHRSFDEPQANYNPWADIKGTPFEDHWDRFTASRSPGQTAALKQQIEMEAEDRNTIAAVGGWGMLATLGAGLFSPENLLPAGSIVRGAKIGRAVLKSAMSTAGYAALSTAAGESLLRGSQELRTPQESAVAIGSAAVLGGILGGGTSALFSRADFARLAKTVEAQGALAADRSILDHAEGLVMPARGGDMGAAARPVATLEENTIAGRAAQFAGGAVRDLNPVLRALHSPSPIMRDVATRLFENPIYMRKNMAGVASDPAVETLVKEFTQGAVGRAIEASNGIYGEYRKAGGQLARDEFNAAVGKAMRRADADPDPHVAQAAQVYRSTVFDPLKEHAIKAGLLPEDVSVDTALSYFTRVYDRPRIEAHEATFKGIVREHIDKAIRALEMKRDEIGLGNNIVKADQLAERFQASHDRLTRLEDRLAERAAVRGKKLDDLRDLERRRFLSQQNRPAPEIVNILRRADGGKHAISAIREARAEQRSAGAKRPFSERSPILAIVKRKGGVKLESPLAYELQSMGVTTKTHPGLFRKEGGLGALDNLPWGEDQVIADNLPAGTDGYVDERALMDAIRRELAGDPLRTIDQHAADANADGLDSWAAHWLDFLGLPSDANVATVRETINKIAGAEREAGELASRLQRAESDLERFDAATEELATERTVSAEEARMAQAEVQRLNEDIVSLQQMANASPRVSVIIDYAKARRDLFKAKMRERDLIKRVDALKSLRDAGRANDAMLADLYAKTEDLTRVGDSIRTLTGKVEKLRPMVPRLHQELPDFVNDADRAAYVDEIVSNIFNTVTGRNVDGDIPRDIVAATRGPLKERTFHIEDAKIEDFLVHDVEAVARRYARSMAADVELKNAFGKADLKEQIDQIKRNYADLRAAVDAGVNPETGEVLGMQLTPTQKHDAIKRLVAREKADIRDIQALRDMVRGTYLARENSTNFARVARVASSINFIRTMGGVTLSSLTDIGRHIMVHGLGGIVQDGLVPLIRNAKAVKLSVEEAKLAGAVMERVLNTRMATWAEITDPYSAASPFERWMANTANGFSKLTLMGHWNDLQKSFASVLTQNRVLRGVGQYARLDKRETAYLAYLGIDRDMASRIAKQFAEHGSTEEGGVRVAHSDDWSDDWARRVYRAAVNKDVDSTIITKGMGDIPLFMHTPAGRLLGQFKGFALASHQRALMRGLQEKPMGMFSGLIVSVAAGMMIYYLKSIESNRASDISNNPGRWLAEGLDRSGLFAIAFEVNNTIEKALGVGAYGALAAAFPGADQSGKASRYLARSTAAGFLGPTGDFVDGLVRVATALKGAGNGLSDGDISAIKRMIPGATLPGIRTLVEYLGVPAARAAVGTH